MITHRISVSLNLLIYRIVKNVQNWGKTYFHYVKFQRISILLTWMFHLFNIILKIVWYTFKLTTHSVGVEQVPSIGRMAASVLTSSSVQSLAGSLVTENEDREPARSSFKAKMKYWNIILIYLCTYKHTFILHVFHGNQVLDFIHSFRTSWARLEKNVIFVSWNCE